MEQQFLIITALSVGFLHTILGPDHYLPFIAIGKARNWSLTRTASITVIAGIGHVLGSILIGIAGIAFGIALGKLEWFEAARADIASWILIAFGLVYTIYGIRQAIRNKTHVHIHSHGDGKSHIHKHTHHEEHLHVHDEKKNITPWVLFIIFVFGPCEALIPILMYPAIQSSISQLFWVTLAFGLATVATMTAVVVLSMIGIRNLRFSHMERYMHVIAGIVVLLCGISIKFLGL